MEPKDDLLERLGLPVPYVHLAHMAELKRLMVYDIHISIHLLLKGSSIPQLGPTAAEG